MVVMKSANSWVRVQRNSAALCAYLCSVGMGSAFGIAAKDIIEKVGIMRVRLAELRERGESSSIGEPLTGDAAAEDPSKIRLTCQWLILDEVSPIKRIVARLNAALPDLAESAGY